MIEGLPAHDARVLESASTLLAVVVLVPICLVDDLFRDDLLNDIYAHHTQHPVPPRSQCERTFKRNNTNRTALLARRVADQQEVRTTSLAEGRSCSMSISCRTEAEHDGDDVQVVERLEAVDGRISFRKD